LRARVDLFVFKTPKNQKTKKQKQACSNQANLVNFFLRAHYNVQTLTQPCKRLW
jgi:hypothetical protein